MTALSVTPTTASIKRLTGKVTGKFTRDNLYPVIETFPPIEFRQYGATRIVTIGTAAAAGYDTLEVRDPNGSRIVGVLTLADGRWTVR